jgi:hypothetical protein
MNKRGLEVNAEAGSTIEGCQMGYTKKFIAKNYSDTN